MAFTIKDNINLLNVKITSKGRESIPRGNFNFKYFAIGDSEIDYKFKGISFIPEFLKVLQPLDRNPKILSFLKKETGTTEQLHEINGNIVNDELIVYKTVDSTGFFAEVDGQFEFKTDLEYLKQADAEMQIKEVSGRTLQILQSSTYEVNKNEPEVGDTLLIKWTNYEQINPPVNVTVDESNPVPYLLYRIDEILSGSLETNDLYVNVDREMIDINLYTGENTAKVLIFYNYDNTTANTIYNQISTDFISTDELMFIKNCSTPIKYPYWNLLVINTEDIAGVQKINKDHSQYKSHTYGGFVDYIQNKLSVYDKLGVIHYTNQSPFNTYGESFAYVEETTTTTTTLAPTTTTTTTTGETTTTTTTTTGETTTTTTTTDACADFTMDIQVMVEEEEPIEPVMTYDIQFDMTWANYPNCDDEGQGNCGSSNMNIKVVLNLMKDDTLYRELEYEIPTSSSQPHSMTMFNVEEGDYKIEFANPLKVNPVVECHSGSDEIPMSICSSYTKYNIESGPWVLGGTTSVFTLNQNITVTGFIVATIEGGEGELQQPV